MPVSDLIVSFHDLSRLSYFGVDRVLYKPQKYMLALQQMECYPEISKCTMFRPNRTSSSDNIKLFLIHTFQCFFKLIANYWQYNKYIYHMMSRLGVK